MTNKIILEINRGGESADDRKTAAIPSRRRWRPGRRRGSEPQIRFWDLGQVNNNESLDDEPVWSDHPILLSPDYTTSHTTWGSTNAWFQGVQYSVDPFGNTEYQAYTDMFFEYPVTEWKKRYRRILGVEDFATDSTAFKTDMRFSLRDSTYSGSDEKFIPERNLSQAYLDGTIAPGTFNTQKESYLTNYLYYFHNDRDYAGYRGLDRLEGQINPDGAVGGYFGYSTGDPDYFKVTATNDPDADAVTLGEPSGSYDVFLMPQVGFFMAVSHSSDWKTSEVMFAYQVMPRHLWPRYLEDPDTTGTLGEYGSDSAVNSWLAYQKARLGMKYSTWTYTGSGALSFTYSESEGVPADWTGQTKWGSAVNGSDSEGQYYYRTYYRGSGILVNNQTDYTTTFTANSSDTNFGNALFRLDQPFLTAVIQKGSQFYYVWDISHAAEGFGTFAAFDTFDQAARFKLSRDISWHASYGSPVQPKDGTGPFYDL